MQRFCTIASLFILVPVFLTSCGSKSESKSTAVVVVYGKVNVTTANGNDSSSFDLTALTQCKRNVDTGRVDVTLSQGAGKPLLSFAIKDYSATPKTYSCNQAADNQSSTTDLGGKFDTCMATTSVVSSATATTLNGYAMYREAVATKPFSYAGTCSIQVTAASPAIKGTLSCTKLIQTQLEGAARNPIDTAVTADLTADFDCTFQ